METILIVEDDPAVRGAAARILGRRGYEVRSVAAAREALALCAGEVGDTISLVLSDVVMPQMGGLELASKLAELRPELRVLLMSGYGNQVLGEGCLSPAALIEKPFTPAQLAARVRALLDAPTRAA